MVEVGFVYDDGGMQAAGFRERNDCAVRAVAITLGLPYAEVHAVLAAAGRKPRAGPRHHAYIDLLANRYNLCPVVVAGRLPLGAFIEGHQAGTYVVLIPSHAMAVVNGVVRDIGMSHLSCPVERFYQVG